MHSETFARSEKSHDSWRCRHNQVQKVSDFVMNGENAISHLNRLQRLIYKPNSIPIRLQLPAALLMLSLLTACSVSPFYAPVQPYYRDLSQGVKVYTVRRGDTLYSIGYRSGHGYKRLAVWNNIRPPYNLSVGQKVKLYKPYRQVKWANKSKKKVVKRRNKSHKRSIISTNNKNMLKLFWQWPMKGKIIKNFSASGSKGIDIGGKFGQSVRAAESGKVVYSGHGLIGYGNLLIIKHNYLYLSAYANNSRLLVKEGQTVKKGQVIAKVGKLGTKRTALHFEIRKNGKPVNPIRYLPKK